MPFVLLITGAILLTASVRNTQDNLFALVRSDFTGPNNFIYWFIAIFVIGSIGYIPKAKPVATMFLVLVVLVLVLTRGNPNTTGGGFFEQFTKQIQSPEIKVTPGASLGPALGPAIDGGKAIMPDLSLPENLFHLPTQ
jgi:hypothetical protein